MAYNAQLTRLLLYSTTVPVDTINHISALYQLTRDALLFLSLRKMIGPNCEEKSRLVTVLASASDFDSLDDALRQIKTPRALTGPVVRPALDLRSLEVRVYADAAFANSRDRSSQLPIASGNNHLSV